MKIKVVAIVLGFILFFKIGIPSLTIAQKTIKEYKRVTNVTKTMKGRLQEIDREKSQILNDVNAETGVNLGDAVLITNAISQIKGITIQKIVASKQTNGKDQIIATLDKIKDVGQLSQDIEVLEYTLKTKPNRVASSLIALEKLKLDEKVTILVPNGMLIVRVLFYGGSA